MSSVAAAKDDGRWRALCIIALLFLYSLASAQSTDSITITGQLLGNCNIQKFTLREFDIVNQQNHHVPVSAFGSFHIKIPAKANHQYTLAGGKLRDDFLVTPAQNTYRFTITCRPDGDYMVKLDDSKENDAFNLLGRIESNLVQECSYIMSHNKHTDSCRLALENLFTATRYNLQQLISAYPGTFTATDLAPSLNLPAQLPVENFTAAVVSSVTNHESWNNTELYQTDVPLSFISLVRALCKNQQEKNELVGILLDASPAKQDAAKLYQQAIFQYLFFQLEEPSLFAFCDWAEKHPTQIASEVLKAKLQAMKKTLPGSRFTEVILKDTAGRERKLSDAVSQSSYTLLLFWGLDCDHCREEMPRLLSFYNTYHPKGVEIYAVAMDAEPVKWKNFITENKLSWLNVRENEEAPTSPASDYMLSYTPTLVLIDKEGNILSRFGDLQWVERKIKTLGFK